MMAIAWILYGLIHWQPETCKQYSLATLNAQPDSCARLMVPPLEVYYAWAPPQFQTLEQRWP